MTHELTHREFFTAENFLLMNGEGYNPRDNRTYKMPPLNDEPFTDICTHMSVPPSGQRGMSVVRTNQGEFLGCVYTETGTQAANLILHMPLAKNTDHLIKLESKKLASLYPSWMVNRYGSKNLNKKLILFTNVDVFINKKNKHFVILFDESFLDEINLDQLIAGVDKKIIYTCKGKDGRNYFGLTHSNYEELISISSFRDTHNRSAKDESIIMTAFRRIADNYLAMMIDAQLLEKVIVATYKTKPESYLPTGDNDDRHQTELSFNFWVGAKYNDVVYPFTQDGKIDTTRSIPVVRTHLYTGIHAQMTSNNNVTRISAYTDEEYATLSALKNKMEEINQTLLSIFKTGLASSRQEHDQPLSQSLILCDHKLLQLENKKHE